MTEENETVSSEEVKWNPDDELKWYREREEHLESRIRVLEGSLMQALFPESNDGNLVAHTKRELELAGLLTEDGDFYGGMTGKAVLDLVRMFARQGHSGMSASIVADIFNKVARFEPLTENDHSLNRDIGEYTPKESYLGEGMHLQDIRDSKWFSNDGGETWHNVYDKIEVE